MDNMKNRILQTIKKNKLLEDNMHIVVGLSGGPDSVCLFDVLCRLSQEKNWKLYCVHINHKLRPKAAEEDQQYVQDMCRQRNVPCRVITADCGAVAREQGITSEEAGRNIRYKAFGEMASEIEKTGVAKEKIAIAFAHNANDQCETILFRILRGSGTDGLAGIAYKRYDENGYAIVRPLLDADRTEIERYCQERELYPRIDKTNSENIYTRNKIRNLLIPYLRENFNENITETINRLGKAASADRDFIKTEAAEAYCHACCGDRNLLSCTYLKNLHKAVRFRVYIMALGKVGMNRNLTYAHAEMIDSVLFSDTPSASAELSDRFSVRRRYEKLEFLGPPSAEHTEGISDREDGVKWHIRTMAEAEFDEYRTAAEGSSKIYGAFCGVEAGQLCIRSRRKGDRINIGKGTKSIQDMLVDEKVPRHLRDAILLLARGNEILWVLPSEHFRSERLRKKGRFSADYKVSDTPGGNIIVLEKL